MTHTSSHINKSKLHLLKKYISLVKNAFSEAQAVRFLGGGGVEANLDC